MHDTSRHLKRLLLETDANLDAQLRGGWRGSEDHLRAPGVTGWRCSADLPSSDPGSCLLLMVKGEGRYDY